MENIFHVYILTNRSATLYIGITSDLNRRIWEHKNKMIDGFTKRYNINKLIYLEDYDTPLEAIAREKELKGWTRQKKMKMIKEVNPNFSEIGIN
ncbi:MAG: GIY-YIG nuclease family protein [Patescibacteria group bacterium]